MPVERSGFLTVSGWCRDKVVAVNPPNALQAPRRVLVVDDDPLNVRVMARFIEKLGHEALGCRNAETALSLVDESIDLLIVDVMMPQSTVSPWCAPFARAMNSTICPSSWPPPWTTRTPGSRP